MLLLGHAFLWKHGIEHSDPSLWNVMCHPIRKCGVLTDFDLSIIAWRTRVLGTDRTGTIPFMALELLRKAYWDGKVIRRYHHELEAFIWMLPFVFLAYDNGKLDPNNQFIKYWITSDYLTCGEKKLAYISTDDLIDSVSLVGSAFKDYKGLMLDACDMLHIQHVERKQQRFNKLRQQIYSISGELSAPAPHVEHSTHMWEQFLPVLSCSGIDTTRLEKHRPIFDRAQCQDLFSEMETIYNSLGLAI